jgi:hypothetical protein
MCKKKIKILNLGTINNKSYQLSLKLSHNYKNLTLNPLTRELKKNKKIPKRSFNKIWQRHKPKCKSGNQVLKSKISQAKMIWAHQKLLQKKIDKKWTP